MGRVVNWVYAAILVVLALEANWTNFVPEEFLPYAVILMGTVILLTSIKQNNVQGYPARMPRWTDYARRYVLGPVIIIMGLATVVLAVNEWAPLIAIDTNSGALILAAIAAIYVLASIPQTRNLEISSI